ncbi:MAG: tetratricopeptide repeat protein, partial [Acidobacteria bacterium]|nr:tetratricopeptide repeat protein [Acidobacteriota bacterium]
GRTRELTIPKRRRVLIAGVLLVAAVFAVAGYFYLTRKENKTIQSIAVMPFVNESGNADVEYISDGMTETLISSLSQLPNLNVKARSSVFRYKGKEASPQTIGKELNVQAVLSGRIMQRGDQLTLTLELVDAQTENVLWSAYRLYLQGRFYWNKREEKNFRKAIEYFNQAIALDPNYALAYAGLADTYALLSSFGFTPPSEGMTKAQEFARQALSLDDSLAEPHATLGLTRLSYGYDFAGAEREYQRAIELNPNYVTAHQWYGEMLTCVGRFDEAAAEYRRALELDPLSLPVNWEYARFFYYARRFDEAIARYGKVFELDAGFTAAHRTLAEVYRVKGDYAKAIEEQAKAFELEGELRKAALLREAFAKGGWNGFLRLVTAEDSPLKYRHAIVARAHLQLGEKDKAFAELNKAYETRESPLQWLKVEPQFDPLRDDPRFQELLKKVGFP